jgi:hypothetical protein
MPKHTYKQRFLIVIRDRPYLYQTKISISPFEGAKNSEIEVDIDLRSLFDHILENEG